MEWTREGGTTVEIRNARKLRLYVTRERKRLKTGEEKVYERVRGVTDLEGEDVSKEWYAIDSETLTSLAKLVDAFDRMLSKIEARVEITEEKYPELYRVLREYERKTPNAWAWIFYGYPHILLFLQTLLDYPETERIQRVLEEERIEGDAERIRDEILDVVDTIVERVEEFLFGLGEVSEFEWDSYNEWNYYIVFDTFGDGLVVNKRFVYYLDKDGDKYVLTVTGRGGRLRIGDSIIAT